MRTDSRPSKKAPARADVRSKPAKQEHNHPITVEEFDRERLGVAAKE